MDAYAQWNPYTPQVQGALKIGAPLVIYARMSGRFTRMQHEVVTIYEPGQRIGWARAGASILLKSQRLQILKALDPDRTHYYTYESFSGALAWLEKRRLGKDIERGFRNMSEALKRRAEAGGE